MPVVPSRWMPVTRLSGPIARYGVIAAAAASLLVLPSCARFTPPDRTSTELPIPAAFSLYETAGELPDAWWNSFDSGDLNALVDAALSGNFTIAQAAARIRQAGAVARQAGAPLRPTLSYGADASLSRRRTELGGGESGLDAATRRLNALNALLDAASGGGGGTGPLGGAVRSAQQGRNAVESLLQPSPPDSLTVNTDQYGLGLTAGYEVDVWGRLRADEAAALSALDATREEAHAVVHTIAGQVALTWFNLLETAQVLGVVRGQLETNQTNLGLIELRYRNGLATTLDVYQQRQAVAETESAIPLLEARYELLKHTLNILLGRAPRDDLDLTEAAFAAPGPLPPYGLPADLLARRPDVRAAGLRLRAADWRVAAARADRLPRLQLSAGLSSDAAAIGSLFDSWIAQLAASVTGPLFDGGRREAEIERARAEADERLAAYRQIVLEAVAEVEDALVLIDRQQALIQALDRQLEAARNSHREALGRYRKGLTDYLPVLTALRNLQSLERDVVEAAHDLLVYRVQLHLALGGGWMAGALDAREGKNE
ncbi:MAG: TolC family protein [Candidatus Hydrogenedentes bacterium]|nr:TolC family protein [Candidatus Hydrogenedentota bacterium]